MTERERLLSQALDCLIVALEMDEDVRLRRAKNLIEMVAMGAPPKWWMPWRRKDDAA